MRRRRAERLALRAQASVEAGCFEDARMCLAEARALSPTLPQLDVIERNLPDPGSVAVAEAVDDVEPTMPVGRPRVAMVAVVVIVIIASFGVAGWFATRAAVAPDAVTVETSGHSAPAAVEPMPAPSTVFAKETAATQAASEPAPTAIDTAPVVTEPTASQPEPRRQELPASPSVATVLPDRSAGRHGVDSAATAGAATEHGGCSAALRPSAFWICRPLHRHRPRRRLSLHHPNRRRNLLCGPC